MISISSCSWKELETLALRCGFYIREGRKHSIVEDKTGKFITSIPRKAKGKLDKWTVKGIIAELKKAGCSEKVIG